MIKVSISFRISRGSKLKENIFLSLGLFVGRSSISVELGCLGITSVWPGAQGRADYQLQHASLGFLPFFTQPLSGVLESGCQPDMISESVV